MDISSLTPGKRVKLQYWLDVIRQCRASGMTNQDWCEQNTVSLKSYYYWLAKIRKLALEDFPRRQYASGLPAGQKKSELSEHHTIFTSRYRILRSQRSCYSSHRQCDDWDFWTYIFGSYISHSQMISHMQKNFISVQNIPIWGGSWMVWWIFFNPTLRWGLTAIHCSCSPANEQTRSNQFIMKELDYVFIYKCFERGHLQWPRPGEEARHIS